MPQGSSDRLVQITGSVAANVGHAKVLMEDTIRRNQSPLPDTMTDTPPEPPKVMSAGDNNNEYKFTVKVGDEIIKITSSSLSLVKSAKIVLDDYFSHGEGAQKIPKAKRRIQPQQVATSFSNVDWNIFFANPGFSLVANRILEFLDYDSIKTCLDVSPIWKEYIDGQKNWRLKKLFSPTPMTKFYTTGVTNPLYTQTMNVKK